VSGPTASLMPHSHTMRRASSVARSRSLPAPVVMPTVAIFFRVIVRLVDRQLLRQAQRHAAQDDRHLMNRISVRKQHVSSAWPAW
jgi:hypothetical protein